MAVVAAEAQKGTPFFSADITLGAPHPRAKSTVKCIQVELKHEGVHFGERLSLK